VEELKGTLLFVALFAPLLLLILLMGSYTKSYSGRCVNQMQRVNFEPRHPPPDFRILDVTDIIVVMLLVVFIIGIAVKLLKKD
jgi:hypothetical protein